MLNLSKEKYEYTLEKIKEYVSANYTTKEELGNIEAILDEINGEVV